VLRRESEAWYVLKEAARVVGIGAGIVGFGVADHLAQMGWRDLLIGDGGPRFRAEYPQVVLASPCSGHGFKFASVVGKILANLVADVEAPYDTSIFRLYRLTRLPRRSLRRAIHIETGSTP
jgi:glycine/D-amino acid oxidase-like deaminating enzyme